MRGMLYTDDDILKISLKDKTDLSVRMSASKISAGLGIPIPTENLNLVAKTVVYEQRKAMKCAVDIAFAEMKEKHEALMSSQKVHYEAIILEKDKGTKKAKNTLHKEREFHKKQMKALEELHIADIDEAEKEHVEFVTQLVKTHREKMTRLREKLGNSQVMHQRVLDSYVEASSDTLRMLQESDSPPEI